MLKNVLSLLVILLLFTTPVHAAPFSGWWNWSFNTDCSSVVGEGVGCWDTDDDILYIGDGVSAVAVGPGGATLDQTVTVAKSGGDYTTIQGAIDSITDNATGKRYVIIIYPGVYTENVVMEEYVSLVGYDHETTEITSASGTTVTAPPGASDAAISDLKITSTPTADGAICLQVTTGEVDVYSTYFKMTSSTNGVNGALVDIDGGDVDFRGVDFIYNLDGTSAGAETHSIINVAGTPTYHMHQCEADIDVDDVDDVVVFVNEAAAATPGEAYVRGNIIHMDLNSATYSGASGAFYLHGSGTMKAVEHNHIHVETAGNGTGYAFYMDTTATGGEIHATSNRVRVAGFTNNYGINVASGDTVISHFNDVVATSGNTGAGTLTYVTSLSDGDLTATGTIGAGTLTEGGNAVYNSTETPGGALGGTWASPTVDSDGTWTGHNSYPAACNAGEYVNEIGDTNTCVDATTEINSVINGAGGTNLTCASQTCNVDDAFLVNNGSDTMTGTLTADGLTLGANENITLGAQTLDHDGTDFKFSDTINVTGIDVIDASEQADGALSGTPRKLSFTLDPGAWYDTDTQVYLGKVGDDAPNGIVIDEWEVNCNVDPDVEMDLDLKRASAWIGLTSAAVMDVLDTTNGTATEDTDANINADATVANGQYIYLEFGADPEGTCVQLSGDIWYHAVD